MEKYAEKELGSNSNDWNDSHLFDYAFWKKKLTMFICNTTVLITGEETKLFTVCSCFEPFIV